jgi:hypothetical protein
LLKSTCAAPGGGGGREGETKINVPVNEMQAEIIHHVENKVYTFVLQNQTDTHQCQTFVHYALAAANYDSGL